MSDELRDSVVGEYEHEYVSGDTYKQVFLDNGISEFYFDGKKIREAKWSIVDGEIHRKFSGGTIYILKINADKSITSIATIDCGEREDFPKDDQNTYIKTK